VFVPGVAQPGQHTTFHLIDGQQRLTTSSVILAAARNVARQLGQQELADEIHQYYLVHPLKKGEQHYRLLPKERDHDSYLSLVSGEGTPTGRIADALQYFEERLSEMAEASPDQLRRFFNTVCQRLEFMCATLEAENAYNIFKSLNSTGVPLGPSDLIRNFVFMHVAPEDQDEFDRDLWGPLEDHFANADGTLGEERFSKFFRDYLMSGGRYVAASETFPSFEARYEATDFSPHDLARTLTASVRHYSIISGQKADHDARVTQALAGLNLLDSSTTYPLLLNLFEQRRSGVIDDARLTHAIEMLRGFILRRFICNETSRGYGQMFVRALAKDAGDPVKALESYLLDRGWPDDHEFEAAFSEFPLYRRGYAREVLETLERARGHKEPAALDAAQVEHVLPQTLSDQWIEALGSDAESIHADYLHRPGNLTLSAYNAELWNHPFGKKRERYAQSNIVLTRELADQARWTETEIQSRGWQLAKEAAQIWIGPKEKVARAEPEAGDDDEGPGRQELRRRFWTGLNDYLVAEHPDLPDFEGKPNWAIRLPSGVRHIGFDLRFSLRHDHVGIDVWFWREQSIPIWERIRASPAVYNELAGTGWEFEQVEGRTRTRMFIDLTLKDARDEACWVEGYSWLGSKLSLLYEKIAPKLRQEMDQSEADLPPTGDSTLDDEELSETQILQTNYWAALYKLLEPKGGFVTGNRRPQPRAWMTFPLGRSRFHLNTVMIRPKKQVRVEIYIGGDQAKAYFRTLRLQNPKIERELGYPLVWEELPARRDCRISCYLNDADPEDEADWPRQHEWLSSRLYDMHRVFAHRVRSLDVDSTMEEP
jgi:hypothetical protein